MWAGPGVFGFFIAVVTSMALAQPIMAFLRWTKSSQTISAHAPATHQVKQGTPTMGGLIILAGAVVAYISLILRRQDAPHAVSAGQLSGLILLIGFGLIGFIDDFVVPRMIKGKRGLGWKQKIGLQILLGAIATQVLGLGFTATSGAYLFLILFFSNAYNFSDGLDGLSGLLLLTFALGIGLMCPTLASREVVLFLMAPLVGGAITFLFLNAPPAKVFMGDVGSLPIGAIMGLCVAMAALPDPSYPSTIVPPTMLEVRSLALLILSFVMIAELVPVPLQIASVKLLKRKLFPYTPIHHAFERAGWPETRVVFCFVLVQILCSAGAAGITYGDYWVTKVSRESDAGVSDDLKPNPASPGSRSSAPTAPLRSDR